MIDQICKSKRIVKELRAGPLGPYLGRLADHIARGHEQQGDARRILLCAGRFASFAEGRGQGTDEWDDETLVGFLLQGDVTTADAFHASDVRAALCEIGLMEGDGPPASESLSLLADFAAHLRDVRGLSLGVRRVQTNTLRRLLAFHRERHGEQPLGAFTGKDALDLFQRGGDLYRSVGTRQKFAAELRQILRFLHLRDHIEQDLAATVPLFINYRLSTVPAHLPWEDVRRLITRIDTAVAPGKRDRAILLLIAGLGLRPGTVRALTLDQVFWREAELRIPRTKSRRGINVPLTGEVGQALSTYVLEERPKTELRTVFLTQTTPHGPFTSGSAITAIINSRLKRAGIPNARGAANLLRHSLATQLVNAGVPIKQVSDLFGHKSIDTTAIYTKVDVTSLAAVPMPFALGVAA
jgi:integrase/recombinase XerD